MRVSVAAHAMDRAGGASADGIRVATWMFGSDGDGTIRAANDGAFVVKGIVLLEINDETGILRTGGESDGGADLNAERSVGLGVGDTRLGRGVALSAAPDIDGAWRGSRATSVGRSTDAGIGRGTNVIFDALLGLSANREIGQEKRQNKQTADNRKITIDLHWAPHVINISEPRTWSSIKRSAEIASKWLVRARTFQMVLLQEGAGFVPVDDVDELPWVS